MQRLYHITLNFIFGQSCLSPEPILYQIRVTMHYDYMCNVMVIVDSSHEQYYFPIQLVLFTKGMIATCTSQLYLKATFSKMHSIWMYFFFQWNGSPLRCLPSLYHNKNGYFWESFFKEIVDNSIGSKVCFKFPFKMLLKEKIVYE